MNEEEIKTRHQEYLNSLTPWQMFRRDLRIVGPIFWPAVVMLVISIIVGVALS